MRAGAVGEFQFATDIYTPEPPSHYAKQNCWYGASSPSPMEIAERHVIGTDRILWGSDYPHYEGTYPHTRLSLRHTFNEIPEEERRQILGLNAAKLYNFDLEALAPLAAKVGPTPEDISSKPRPEEFPERAHTNALRRA